jgi:hypothetical protein
MKRVSEVFTALLMFLAMVLGLFLPMLAIGIGLISLAIENPKVIVQLFVVYSALFSIIWCVYKLAVHPKTKAATEAILCILAVAFFVHSCSTYTGSAGDCLPSAYITC